MQGLKTSGQTLFNPQWQGTLSDYVTAVAWSPSGQLAASSAAGEVVLWTQATLTPLQAVTEQSIDCLAFSKDGQFIAAGGQDGRVKIWQQKDQMQLIHTLENAPAWVDKLAWCPTTNLLAFSIGRYVQVWDANKGEVVATLNFEASSVLGISWHPDGKLLAVAGNQGIKVWNALIWDDDPDLVSMGSASVAIAWSPDGKYLTSGNMDFTITVLEWENRHLPWVMRGFPGKIRNLAWSDQMMHGAPLLGVSSVEGVVVWEKHRDETVGWESRVLDAHEGVVHAIAFQPDTFLFASAAADGLLCLWEKAEQLAQILDGAAQGFSCLAWHPQGAQLAAGGQDGELLVWSKSRRGTGFGRR